jgi:hypothetical protein
MWGLSINIPIIVVLAWKLLASYITCKSEINDIYFGRFLSVTDNIFQGLYIIFLLLTINGMFEELFATSIVFLV